MLRTASSALVCAVFFVSVSSSPLTGTRPPGGAFASTAGVPAAQATNEVQRQVHGHVRPAEQQKFDPFGVIVALPVFTLEQFQRPAFDPKLYRGGRASEPLAHGELCNLLEEVAEEYELPLPLFVRLIWQESRFRNEVVSHAGAQGIAQFMPRTAELRGLDDPFDPLEALPASADFLRELMEQFGNFGLAAAAYNGGPTRVRNWLDGRSTRLPKETQDYVLRITGKPVEHWRKAASAEAHPEAFKVRNCRVKPIRAATEAASAQKSNAKSSRTRKPAGTRKLAGNTKRNG